MGLLRGNLGKVHEELNCKDRRNPLLLSEHPDFGSRLLRHKLVEAGFLGGGEVSRKPFCKGIGFLSQLCSSSLSNLEGGFGNIVLDLHYTPKKGKPVAL